MTPETMNRILEPIRNRIRMLAARALISSVSDGSGGITLELTLGAAEVRDDVDLVQQYGISSKPKPGSQAVTIFISGSRAEGVTIATKGAGADMEFHLDEGEVALHTDEGDSVHLKRGRIVEITTETLRITASTAVEIDSPKLSTTGNVQADGDLQDALGTVSTLRTAFNSHVHNSAAVGAPTGPAIPQA